MAKKKENKKRYWIFTAVLLIIVLILIISQIKVAIPVQKKVDFNSKQNPSQVYKNKFLKITISLPNGYKLRDLDNDIELKNDKGEISIGRIGTNFSTIDDYLQNMSEQNKFEIADKKKKVINNLESRVVIIKHPISGMPDDKAYYFYPAPWTVFSITTGSEALYNDLDQIAESFRYTP